MKPRGAWIEGAIVVALLAVFTALAAGESRHSSATVDEFHLVPQAIALRATGDLNLGYKTPPLLKRWIGLAVAPSDVQLPDPRFDGKIAADGWTPWYFGTRFLIANPATYEGIFLRARAMMLPIAWALGLVLWSWARSAGGRSAGLAALGFFAFSPELVSFASVVSLDLAVTALVVALVATLRVHARTASTWSMAAAGALFGLGLSVKLSVLFLAPLFLVALFGRALREKHWTTSLLELLLAVGLALLAIQASYGFDHALTRWGQVAPASNAFRKLDALLPDEAPIPLPLLFLRALDGQARDVQSADVLSYLDGEWSDQGWRRYYLMAWLYKTPLPLLGIVALLGFEWLRSFLARARGRAAGAPRMALHEWLFVVVPLALWGGMFSLSRGLDIGIRYVLPCYAILCVGCGIAAARVPLRSAAGVLLAALGVAYAGASLAAYPHHLSYVNRLGGGNENAWRHLADSNVDWGQELKHLSAYLHEHGIERVGLGYFGHVAPELYRIDYFVPQGAPAPGWYAISANFVAGYSYLAYDHGKLSMTRPDQFAAFRERTPLATLGGALLIYRVE